MITEAQAIYQNLQTKILQLPVNELLMSENESNSLRSKKIEQLIEAETFSLPPDLRTRVKGEFLSWGPLESLLKDEQITEILVNGPKSIWFEKGGRLQQYKDIFFSELSFRQIVERISFSANAHLTVNHPTADGNFGDFRVSLIGSELAHGSVHISLRRHPKNPWTFSKLSAEGWCQENEAKIFSKIISERKNFLVIGATGAGKTSVLNSFLNLLPEQERVVVIEDTSEIVLPNSASMKLLTRIDPQGLLPEVDQAQLVKRSLRLRPDRLVMGEVRGSEAKDFLMALATGHSGSFGTLHANNAQQALIRLEMLIQMGAPQWSLTAIRRLIQLSLDYIVIAGRESSGQRKFKGVFRISSLEDQGFLIERVEHLPDL